MEDVAHTIEDKEGVVKEKKDDMLEVYERFYKELLTRIDAEIEVEKETEEIVKITMRSIEIIAEDEETKLVMQILKDIEQIKE